MDKTKLKWMRKLATTKNFVVLTDTEAVARIKNGKDDFGNLMLIASYKAELEMFKHEIEKAITLVDRRMAEMMGETPKKPRTRKHKITVKNA